MSTQIPYFLLPDHALLTQIPQIPSPNGLTVLCGGGCPGLFPRSVLQRRDQEGVCSLLDPRSGQDWLFVESYGQSLYKQVRLSTGIHARCPVILVRAGEGRLRSGAWDLKELKSSNIEPGLLGSHEAIFIMVRRWIIFCH